MNLYGAKNGIVRLNYDKWSEQIRFQLGFMDLDLSLLMDEKPTSISETSSKADKSIYHAWDKSNRLSLSLMNITLAEM